MAPLQMRHIRSVDMSSLSKLASGFSAGALALPASLPMAGGGVGAE